MLHVVLCVRYGAVIMYHGVREERLLRREGGGGGGRCCLRADHGIGSGYVGVFSFQVDLQYIKGQIGGFVLHKLYISVR